MNALCLFKSFTFVVGQIVVVLFNSKDFLAVVILKFREFVGLQTRKINQQLLTFSLPTKPAAKGPKGVAKKYANALCSGHRNLDWKYTYVHGEEILSHRNSLKMNLYFMY